MVKRFHHCYFYPRARGDSVRKPDCRAVAPRCGVCFRRGAAYPKHARQALKTPSSGVRCFALCASAVAGDDCSPALWRLCSGRQPAMQPTTARPCPTRLYHHTRKARSARATERPARWALSFRHAPYMVIKLLFRSAALAPATRLPVFYAAMSAGQYPVLLRLPACVAQPVKAVNSCLPPGRTGHPGECSHHF
jgi:hypothetical protein